MVLISSTLFTFPCSFGLVAAPLVVQPLGPNQTIDTSVLVKVDSAPALSSPPNRMLTSFSLSTVITFSISYLVVQVALKNQLGVMYFQLLIPLHLLFREGGGLTQQPWLALWKGDLANQEQRTICTLGIPLATVSVKLQANCFYIVAERQIENKVPLYCVILLTIIFHYFIVTIDCLLRIKHT